MAKKLKMAAGDVVDELSLVTMHGRKVYIPDRDRMIHLQFRRFAGCPVCDLHLRSFIKSQAELEQSGVREMIVFHSTAEALLQYESDLPFEVIPDPQKEIYVRFGVEAAPCALLDPRAWLPILAGVLRSALRVARRRQPLPPLRPNGGSVGLPADFLIDRDGRVLACMYGTYAYDQWSVSDVLSLARNAGQTDPYLKALTI
jgi:peroxiredoxin